MISMSRLPRYKSLRLIAFAVPIFFFACPLAANADASARCASNDSFWIRNYGGSGGSAANAYSAHARQCHLEHNYRTAIVEWEKAIAAPVVAEPAPFELHIWLGTDNYLSGNSESAKHHWRVGLDLARSEPGFRPDVAANELFVRDQFSAALLAYRDTSLTDYNLPAFRTDASHALYEEAVKEALAGSYDKAAQHLAAVLKASPDAYPAHFLLANILQIRGEHSKAGCEWSSTLFSFSADPPTSSISYRWYPSHWDALILLMNFA